jgi:hypothetical protein
MRPAPHSVLIGIVGKAVCDVHESSPVFPAPATMPSRTVHRALDCRLRRLPVRDPGAAPSTTPTPVPVRRR